ncbi:metalloregulator ArsR/SmtB family transcription factor [Arthrobacter sp. Br18]|uniref:ArsR/SmtB family transcription factor n=1 Tax=Arthrobacter sp. Br18 TaxID=1312954 RepID=UPI00047B10D8|nr:metalloregulator ArsR/SmtB family transcription factor [Arthrobacter sp. Br18]
MVMDDVFAVVAEGTRREILAYLRSGDRSVGELVDELQVSQPTVSKHLKVLREAGLVSMRAQGQKRYYSLETAPLHSIFEWLDSFAWNDPRLAGRPGTSGAGASAGGENGPAVDGAGNGTPEAREVGPPDETAASRDLTAARPEALAAAALAAPGSPEVLHPAASHLHAGTSGGNLEPAPDGSAGTMRQQQLGRTMGRAAERAADLLAQFRRRRDQQR